MSPRSRHESPRPASAAPRDSVPDLLQRARVLNEQLHANSIQLRMVASAHLARTSAVAESGPLGYLALEPNGRILGVNTTICSMLGKGRSELVGMAFDSVVAREERSRFLDYLLRCRAQEYGDYASIELRLEVGRYIIPVQLLTHSGVGADGVVFYRTAVIDRSADAAMESALKASERRQSAAIAASGAGVFEHEVPLGEQVYVSEGCASLLGYERRDVPPGRTFLRWIRRRCHRADRGRLNDLYRDLMGEGERYQIETRMRHRNGSWRWMKLWARVVSETDGRRRFVGVMMDVTEDRRKTDEVERRSRQLRRLTAELLNVEERERRQIASDLHDDLAQIIVATNMKLTALQREAASEEIREELQESIELLERADRATRSLIFQVSPPVLEEVGLVPVLEWLARDLHTQFDLDVSITSHGDVPRVELPVRYVLFRSVRELLINVAKHAGTLEARVDISWTEEGTIRVTVSDQGRGFDWSALTEHGEVGFGLFSMEARFESMGGSLEVDTARGRGTSISIVLPLDDPERGDALELQSRTTPPPTSIPPPTAANRLRVLLVDDHDLVRMAMAQMVTSQPDIEVVGEAADGESALALAHRVSPDVVLMDVTMPGMGGIEATRRLSRDCPHARVIGLSMHESDEVERAMRDAGAIAFLRKNDSRERLLSTIRDTVTRPHP